MRGPARWAMPVLLACALSSHPARAQVRTPLPLQQGQLSPRQAAARAHRAQQLLEYYLKAGLARPYEATQATQLFGPTPLRSVQLVKSDGPGRMRIEYLAPPAMRGEVILVKGGRMIRYAALGKGSATGETAQADDPAAGVEQLIRAVRAGQVTLALGPMRTIAGRQARAVIVTTSPGGPFRRLWIDPVTGIRMRQETCESDGDLTSASTITRIDLTPIFAPRDFEPINPSAIGRPDRYPAAGVFRTLTEAQALVAFPIRTPRLPDDYRLTGCWVTILRLRRQVALRYSDGVSSFVLLQHPVAITPKGPGAFAPGRRVVRPAGTVQWLAGGRLFTLAGRVSQEDTDLIISSLQ